VYAKVLSRLRAWRDPGGATALEFALVIPIFIVLLLGAFPVHCTVSATICVQPPTPEKLPW
jgi:Flp pilus assembly pilin Flp